MRLSAPPPPTRRRTGFHRLRPDVVILDVGPLSGNEGLELVRTVRQEAETLLVFVTGGRRRGPASGRPRPGAPARRVEGAVAFGGPAVRVPAGNLVEVDMSALRRKLEALEPG